MALDIFYRIGAAGSPFVLAWAGPVLGRLGSADDVLLNNGFRVIAMIAAVTGGTTQTATGHDMDHYADDLAILTEHLNLKNAVHVGHSTGGGEVVPFSRAPW